MRLYLVISLAVVLALAGCSRTDYRASFAAVIGYEEPLPSVGPGDCVLTLPGEPSNTMRELLQSKLFWRDFVVPRLPVGHAATKRTQSPVIVVVSAQRVHAKKIIGDFTLELRHGDDALFEAVLSAFPEFLKSIPGWDSTRDIGSVIERKKPKF